MLSKPQLQSISVDFNLNNNIEIDALRLDLIHAIISGNKWYKLKYYLQEAREKNIKTIATFGGAFSNHIVATAFAAKEFGFNSIGVIRGEEPKKFSHTLMNAKNYGMNLYFVSRENYKNKEAIKKNFATVFWIDEGGFGLNAAKGASEILDNISLEKYSHILVAVGTGATFAGIIKKSLPTQKVIGISVMKNNFELINQIKFLLTKEEQEKNFELIHDYHFGGYSKKNDELIDFMNEIYSTTSLPLDFVYTAKTFYAMKKLINEKSIPSNSKILFIHTGGLQGNLSLAKGILKF